MKKLILMAAAIVAVSFASCGGNKAANAEAVEEEVTTEATEVVEEGLPADSTEVVTEGVEGEETPAEEVEVAE